MQLKKIVLAYSVALALPLSMTAHAFAPSGPYDTAGALVVFLSGSSSADNLLTFTLAACRTYHPSHQYFPPLADG